jgi:hypothetical protein
MMGYVDSDSRKTQDFHGFACQARWDLVRIGAANGAAKVPLIRDNIPSHWLLGSSILTKEAEWKGSVIRGGSWGAPRKFWQ